MVFYLVADLRTFFFYSDSIRRVKIEATLMMAWLLIDAIIFADSLYDVPWVSNPPKRRLSVHFGSFLLFVFAQCRIRRQT